MKKYLPVLIIIAVAIVGGFLYWQKIKPRDNNNGNPNVILFYGSGCPHCANVSEFIKTNNIRSKVSFQEKEIFYNKDNANLLMEKAAACGLKSEEVGVPFLWDGTDGNKCYMGDVDVTNYFQSK